MGLGVFAGGLALWILKVGIFLGGSCLGLFISLGLRTSLAHMDVRKPLLLLTSPVRSCIFLSFSFEKLCIVTSVKATCTQGECLVPLHCLDHPRSAQSGLFGSTFACRFLPLSLLRLTGGAMALQIFQSDESFALFYFGSALCGGMLALYKDRPIIIFLTAAGGAFGVFVGIG